jgi:hypothetical protein
LLFIIRSGILFNVTFDSEEMHMPIPKKLPICCPGCLSVLKVKRFECPRCSTSVEGDFALPLLAQLPQEDQEFIVKLVKASGSLKDMAREYGVSYPTVRNRLDDLIEKIKTTEGQIEKGEKK